MLIFGLEVQFPLKSNAFQHFNKFVFVLKMKKGIRTEIHLLLKFEAQSLGLCFCW